MDLSLEVPVPHHRQTRTLPHDFKCEVHVIIKELGIRLEKLLEQHEAYLVSGSLNGNGDTPHVRGVSCQRDSLPLAVTHTSSGRSDPGRAAKLRMASVANAVAFLNPGSKALPACPEQAEADADAEDAAARLAVPGALPGFPDPPPGPPSDLPPVPIVARKSTPASVASKRKYSEKFRATIARSSFDGGPALEARSFWTEEPTDAQIEAIIEYEDTFKLQAVEYSSSSGSLHKQKMDILKSTSTPAFRQQGLQGFRPTCGIMHPGGKARALWNFVSLILICQDALTIPLLVFGVGDSTPWEVFAWFCTFFWTADMILSFRTGYFVGVKVEMRAKEIAKQYAMTWLALDLFIVLFEWFSRFYSSFAPSSVVRTTKMIRVVRLVKLLRIAKMKDLVNDFLERIKSNALTLLLHVIFLALVLCVVCHFVACGWYALGESSPDGWTSYDVYATEYADKLGFFYWYLSSTRWVISQLNGRTDMGEKRNMSERAFTVLVGVLMAVVGQSVFVALITKSMMQLSELYKKQEERRRSVNDYLSLHSVSHAVERSIKVHAREYKDIDDERRREGIVLALLPKHLQSDLLFEVRKPLLDSHPLFSVIMRGFGIAAHHLCCDVIKQLHAVTHEMIFNTKDPCTRMLLLDTGTMVYGQGKESGSTVMDEDTDSESDVKRDMKKEDIHQFLPEASVVTRVTHGMWLSEAALWVLWENRGVLLTQDNCCMLEVDVLEFGPAIQQHVDAYGLSVVYARYFVRFLIDEQYLSDILSFGVQNMMYPSSSEGEKIS